MVCIKVVGNDEEEGDEGWSSSGESDETVDEPAASKPRDERISKTSATRAPELNSGKVQSAVGTTGGASSASSKSRQNRSAVQTAAASASSVAGGSAGICAKPKGGETKVGALPTATPSGVQQRAQPAQQIGALESPPTKQTTTQNGDTALASTQRSASRKRVRFSSPESREIVAKASAKAPNPPCDENPTLSLNPGEQSGRVRNCPPKEAKAKRLKKAPARKTTPGEPLPKTLHYSEHRPDTAWQVQSNQQVMQQQQQQQQKHLRRLREEQQLEQQHQQEQYRLLQQQKQQQQLLHQVYPVAGPGEAHAHRNDPCSVAGNLGDSDIILQRNKLAALEDSIRVALHERDNLIACLEHTMDGLADFRNLKAKIESIDVNLRKLFCEIVRLPWVSGTTSLMSLALYDYITKCQMPFRTRESLFPRDRTLGQDHIGLAAAPAGRPFAQEMPRSFSPAMQNLGDFSKKPPAGSILPGIRSAQPSLLSVVRPDMPAMFELGGRSLGGAQAMPRSGLHGSYFPPYLAD